ncbi:MAG TPA: hypothetical protein VGN07_04465 [Steroidobacteraceae bacterium]|jgi:homoserine dehydrogenase
MAGDLIVLKFGSSVLRNRADLAAAVHEIYRWYRAGWRVVAIVSALGDTTEILLDEARDLALTPEPNATAELLATGERHCAALLGIALDRSGVKSRVVDPREIGLAADGSALDSELVAVDASRIAALLDESAVLVVPGFFGYDPNGRLHLLGRGGSDLSAVYLAHTLGARCRLIKDVDGVYECDPALAGSDTSRRFASLGYADALECAGQLIQPKAVRFLESHAASAEVAAIARSHQSVIGRIERKLVESTRRPPLSVLILGLGTVGFGVYQRLSAMPDRFRVIGALVRSRARHSIDSIPQDLLHDSQDTLQDLRPDIVVDALAGLQPSQSLVRYYLAHGINVVSANKALIAEAGIDLSALAAHSSVSLRYSAAVGGGAPMLERLRRETNSGSIRCIAGVLNGTCNFVLDRCAEGLLLNEAVRAAQACGFAEADPGEDLSGRDAGRKLQILARHAFGRDLDALEIEPLNTATLMHRQTALAPNEKLRVIARAWRLESGLFGQVQLESVAADDPFATTCNEWNRLVITREGGEEVAINGRGAGRWPTTEAVLADLFEIGVKNEE